MLILGIIIGILIATIVYIIFHYENDFPIK